MAVQDATAGPPVAPDQARPGSRSPLRGGALPTEHGGWSLTAEPALLGLLVLLLPVFAVVEVVSEAQTALSAAQAVDLGLGDEATPAGVAERLDHAAVHLRPHRRFRRQ